MPRNLIITLSRGVTTFPDDETFHTEELLPPTDAPDASLIKVVIEGNTVTHWWQHTRTQVDGMILRAAAAAGATARVPG